MFYQRHFIAVKMAASRVRPLFGFFKRILPRLFGRVIKDSTETLVLDKVKELKEEHRNLKQGFRPSKQEEEEAIRTSNSNRDPKNNSEQQEINQHEFTNVDHNSCCDQSVDGPLEDHQL